MSALLAFSLGPIQPFIAQARKTRDLWIGSHLLSTLMREGLRDFTGELLFPVLRTEESAGVIADIPNKFVAQHATIEEAAHAAERTSERIRVAWHTLAQHVWDYVFKQEQDETLTAIWRRQTDPDSLFEMYWAVVPYNDSTGANASYGASYRHVQGLLDARKRLRAFARSDEPGEKSTISGERQALHRGSAGHVAAADEVRAFWRALAKRFPATQLSQLGQERLDAADVIKRFATFTPFIEADASFPSTDTLAAAPFISHMIKRLQQQDAPLPLREAAEDWAACAEKIYRASPMAVPALYRLAETTLTRRLLHCDAEALHPGSFSPRRLEDVGLATERLGERSQQGLQAIRTLRRQARDADITPPSSYYAMMLLDGDRMGKLLSSLTSPNAHRSLSKTLSDFAHASPAAIVEGDGLGRVIYAGGDDVLALLPITRALYSARELRNAYSSALRGIAPNATASAGIVFAHRQTPLRMVLRAAREAENTAKERYGRDALVVSLLRRSGAITNVGAHWMYPQENAPALDPVKIILSVSDHLHADDLSPDFVYAMMEEAPTLAALDRDARCVEIKRLLHRQRATGHTESFPDNALDSLADDLVRLAAAFDLASRRRVADENAYELSVDGPRQGLVELSGWLLIAAFLARGEDED